MTRAWPIVERELRKFIRTPVLLVMTLFMPVLNLVVNTAADAGGHVADPEAVLHWIAVRVERHHDGSLQVFFMDSLNGAHSYTDLLNGLRALLH